MSEWKSINLANSLGIWRDEWNRMNHELYGQHPLFDSRFIDGLLKYFGTGEERLFVCTENGATIGMTILTRRRVGIWQSFLPSQLQIAPVLVRSADTLSGLFDVFPPLTWQVDFLCQDPVFSPFDGKCDTDLPVSLVRHALTMQVNSRGSFEDFWRGRPKKLRQNIRRYQSRMKRAELKRKIEKLTCSSQMRLALERFGNLESSGWKGRAGTAVNINNVQGAFYRDMLEKYAETGQAKVYEFYLDDTLASSRLILCGPNIKIALKTAYNENARQYSPGRMLLYETLTGEIQEDSPQESIEFYTNASRDQLEWGSSQRWINHVTLFRNRAFLKLRNLASIRHRIVRRSSP